MNKWQLIELPHPFRYQELRENGLLVATLLKFPQDPGWSTKERDIMSSRWADYGKLIAAAPEMKELLRWWMECSWEHPSNDNHPEDCECDWCRTRSKTGELLSSL